MESILNCRSDDLEDYYGLLGCDELSTVNAQLTSLFVFVRISVVFNVAWLLNVKAAHVNAYICVCKMSGDVIMSDVRVRE